MRTPVVGACLSQLPLSHSALLSGQFERIHPFSNLNARYVVRAVLYKAVVRTGADGAYSMQVTVTLGTGDAVMGPTRLNSDAGVDKTFSPNSVKEFVFTGASVDTAGAPLAISVWYEGSGYAPFDTWQMSAINITNTATGHTWVYGGFRFTETAYSTTLQPTTELTSE